MDLQTVTRAALGRSGGIGDLYNIRTESFTNDTLFTSTPDKEDVTSMDSAKMDIELAISDSLQERFDKLDVEGELQVSVLCGMLTLDGSAAYLADEKESARTQSMSLIYKVKTVNERIMIRNHTDKIDLDVLSNQSTDATHVVVGIDWGANCCVTCEHKNTDIEKSDKVKGDLHAEIKKLKSLVYGKGTGKFSADDKDHTTQTNFSFKCKTDVYDADRNLPVSFEGAVNLAQSLPGLVKNANNGKGVPLTYHLMPLETVARKCNLPKQLHVTYKKIGEITVKECSDALDRILKRRQTLFDLQQDMHSHADYISIESIEDIGDVLSKLKRQEARFRSDLQEVIRRVRSGADISFLDEFISGQMPNAVSSSQYDKVITQGEKDLHQVKTFKQWESKGIKVLKKRDLLDIHCKRNVFVFFQTDSEIESEDLEKMRRFFLRHGTKHCQDLDNEFILVDQKISNLNWPKVIKAPTIHQYVDGHLECKDLYTKEGKDLDRCLVSIGPLCTYEASSKYPVHATLKCPNGVSKKGQCKDGPVNWMCSKCRQYIVYGIDTGIFYCECGKSKPMDATFRCNNENHGTNFVSYPRDKLKIHLSENHGKDEINILIMGETGVGKSTWINGFQNYLCFDTLREAMDSADELALIPSYFSFTQDGVERKITIGEQDTNETRSYGQSSTQYPKAHRFRVGGKTICLIDTPGMGDTRGILQDKTNFQNVLWHLHSYDKIHAVCILLKPNQSRLSVMFQFCIQELLSQLHVSAKDNILFCFTHARGSFYQPGDTLNVLNIELIEKRVGIKATPLNYFCFDNECFRFLACLKNGIDFSETDINIYASSWTKAVEETVRLFEYIRQIKPFEVKHTLDMHETRKVIVAMGKPLSEVVTTIQENIRKVKQQQSEIDKTTSEISDLTPTLQFSRLSLKRVELAFPRTVCAANECVETVDIDESSSKTVYSQFCHKRCRLEGLPTGLLNDREIKRCTCINKSDGNCKVCGHHYTMHMHLRYDIEKVVEQVSRPEVLKQIGEKKGIKAQKEEAKRLLNEEATEMQKERDIVINIGAKFGVFLNASAIIPINDAVEGYIKYCIERDQGKNNEEHLKDLKDMANAYKEQSRLIKDSASSPVEDIMTEVKVLQFKLFNLKHLGKQLKELIDESNTKTCTSGRTNEVLPSKASLKTRLYRLITRSESPPKQGPSQNN